MATMSEGGGEALDHGRAFQGALRELLQVVQLREREVAAGYDVSATQGHVLGILTEGGALAVNDLAARLYLDKSTASRVAAGLEGKGYLSRTRDAGDGRIVRLSASPAGQALWRRIEADLASHYAELLSDFDPEVRTAMTRLLSRLARSFAARIDASRRPRRSARRHPQMSKKSTLPGAPPPSRLPPAR